MGIASIVAAAVGLGWGIAADRIAARWPAHEDGAVRAVDWRTPAVAVTGGAAAFFVVERFGAEPGPLVLAVAVVAAMVLMFATDLDQRLLPDVLTYPIALVALVAFVTGVGPFVRTPGDLVVALAVGVGVPVLLYLLSIPFGAGAIGIGDLKLLFGVSLLVGAARLAGALVVGMLSAALAIVILLVARRITLKSFIPYGPFLILGALWALLRPAA